MVEEWYEEELENLVYLLRCCLLSMLMWKKNYQGHQEAENEK